MHDGYLKRVRRWRMIRRLAITAGISTVVPLLLLICFGWWHNLDLLSAIRHRVVGVRKLSPVSAPFPNYYAPDRVEWLGNIDDLELSEASGLAVSRRDPSILWSHNDSGNRSALYALSSTGEMLARFELVLAESEAQDPAPPEAEAPAARTPDAEASAAEGGAGGTARSEGAGAAVPAAAGSSDAPGTRAPTAASGSANGSSANDSQPVPGTTTQALAAGAPPPEPPAEAPPAPARASFTDASAPADAAPLREADATPLDSERSGSEKADAQRTDSGPLDAETAESETVNSETVNSEAADSESMDSESAGEEAEGIWARLLGSEALADWEDMASFELDGRPYLLVGDIGDNFHWRRELRLFVVAEPDLTSWARLASPRSGTSAAGGSAGPSEAPLVSGSLRPAWTLRFSYPDGPRDSEALAIDIDSESVLLLTKRNVPPELYRVPLRPPVDPDEIRIAERVAALDTLPQPAAREFLLDPDFAESRAQPTGLDIAPRLAAVVTYGDAYLYPREPGQTWSQVFAGLPKRVALPLEPQREAGALSPNGDALYITTERDRRGAAALFRVVLESLGRERAFEAPAASLGRGASRRGMPPEGTRESAGQSMALPELSVPAPGRLPDDPDSTRFVSPLDSELQSDPPLAPLRVSDPGRAPEPRAPDPGPRAWSGSPLAGPPPAPPIWPEAVAASPRVPQPRPAAER